MNLIFSKDVGNLLRDYMWISHVIHWAIVKSGRFYNWNVRTIPGANLHIIWIKAFYGARGNENDPRNLASGQSLFSFCQLCVIVVRNRMVAAKRAFYEFTMLSWFKVCHLFLHHSINPSPTNRTLCRFRYRISRIVPSNLCASYNCSRFELLWRLPPDVECELCTRNCASLDSAETALWWNVYIFELKYTNFHSQIKSI